MRTTLEQLLADQDQGQENPELRAAVDEFRTAAGIEVPPQRRRGRRDRR